MKISNIYLLFFVLLTSTRVSASQVSGHAVLRSGGLVDSARASSPSTEVRSGAVSSSQIDEHNGSKFPEYVQELFVGDVVYTQERHELQIGSAGNVYHADLTDGADISTEFEYGITDKLQIGIGLNYKTIRTEIAGGATARNAGIHNTEIGLAYNISNSPTWSVTAMLEAELPTAKEEAFGEQELEFSPVLVVARDMEFAQVHLSTSAELGDKVELDYNIGGIFPMGEIVGILELNGSSEEDIIGNGFSHSYMITPGIAFAPSGSIEAGIGFPVNLTEKGEWGVVFGASIEFEIGD